jgi:Holliday junction resolvase RusA-like endonuclease
MIEIKISPLSVNKAWKGRRFKTIDYKRFESSMILLLPKSIKMPKKHIKVILVFGFSNKLSDIDNPLKLVLDILQKKYGFNDRDIYELSIKKEIVKKGNEFIKLKLEDYESQYQKPM